ASGRSSIWSTFRPTSTGSPATASTRAMKMSACNTARRLPSAGLSRNWALPGPPSERGPMTDKAEIGARLGVVGSAVANSATGSEKGAAAFGNAARHAGDALLDGLLLLCRLYDRPATPGELTAGLPLDGGRMTPELMERAAARASLAVKVRHSQDVGHIAPGLLPVLLVMQNGSAAVLTRLRGDEATLVYPEMEAREHRISLGELRAE